MKTLQQLIDAAMATTANKEIYVKQAVDGPFKVEIVPVGRPSVGFSSAVTYRIDCYLDGKRVKRSVLAAAMEVK